MRNIPGSLQTCLSMPPDMFIYALCPQTCLSMLYAPRHADLLGSMLLFQADDHPYREQVVNVKGPITKVSVKQGSERQHTGNRLLCSPITPITL